MEQQEDPEVLRLQQKLIDMDRQLEKVLATSAMSLARVQELEALIDSKEDLKEAVAEAKEMKEQKKRIAGLEKENKRLKKEQAGLKVSIHRLDKTVEVLRERVKKTTDNEASVSNATGEEKKEDQEESDDDDDDEIIFHEQEESNDENI